MIFPCTGCVAAKLSLWTISTPFATYPAQPLRAGSWSCSLSLLPPSDAITGYRPDRFIAISLAFPVFIWMRPHWQDMLKLEAAAQRFGDGHLSERIHFDEGSSFERLGVAFNQMADNINALIASKNSLSTESLTNCERR